MCTWNSHTTHIHISMKKKKNQDYRAITVNKVKEPRACGVQVCERRLCSSSSPGCVSVSAPPVPSFCAIPVSQERKVLCWHSNIAEGWPPVANYPACIPAFCLRIWNSLTKKQGSSIPTLFLFFIKDAQYSTRLAWAYLFDEMFDRSLASTHTPHII